MKLPNYDKAYISERKLLDYLLSETHPIGKSKAKFLRSIGFSESNLDALERGLFSIAQSKEVIELVKTPYGTKYVIDGEVQTPKGTAVKLRTIWVIEVGEDIPHFVTAYPR